MKKTQQILSVAMLLLSMMMLCSCAASRRSDAAEQNLTSPTPPALSNASDNSETSSLFALGRAFSMIWDNGETLAFTTPDSLDGQSRVSLDGATVGGASFLTFTIQGTEPLTIQTQADLDYSFTLTRNSRSVGWEGTGPLEFYFGDGNWTAKGNAGSYEFHYSYETKAGPEILEIGGFSSGALHAETDGDDLLITGFSGECTVKTGLDDLTDSFTAAVDQPVRIHFTDGGFKISS